LVEPQNPRQIGEKILGNTRAAIHQDALKPNHVRIANLLRLLTERRQRTTGVSAIPQQRPQHCPVRRKLRQLHANQLSQPVFQSRHILQR